jgi:predicted metal-dependent hydrolase
VIPSGVRRGFDLYNAGHYWQAHEAWEEAWTPDRHGPDRGFYKGLIQIAAGNLHYTRRNRRGAVNKWRSGAALLRPYLPAHQGIDLERLLAATDRNLERLESAAGWPELELPALAQE